MNHGGNCGFGLSRGFLCCLATLNDENTIISAKLDKYPYFDHIFTKNPWLNFGLNAILLTIEDFSFETYNLHPL